MQANIVDLGERRSAADPAKNLKQALEEVAAIGDDARARILMAHLNGLMDWDAEDAIAAAQARVAALARALDFAATLAHRRNRLRAAAAPPPGDAA